MTRPLPHLVLVTLGLWLGGLVALILFVSTLFVKARGVAVDAAPVIFAAFEKYQLALAAVALLTLVLWRLAGRTRTKTLALAATLVATGLAVLQISVITPRINASRVTDRPAFDRYHGYASKNYTTISLFVFAGLLLAVTEARRPALEEPQMDADERGK